MFLLPLHHSGAPAGADTLLFGEDLLKRDQGMSRSLLQGIGSMFLLPLRQVRLKQWVKAHAATAITESQKSQNFLSIILASQNHAIFNFRSNRKQ